MKNASFKEENHARGENNDKRAKEVPKTSKAIPSPSKQQKPCLRRAKGNTEQGEAKKMVLVGCWLLHGIHNGKVKAHGRAMTYDMTDYIKPVFLNTARHHSRALLYQRPDLNVGAIESFWKKLKLLFSNSTVNEKLVFIKNDEIIRDDKEMSHYLIECFINITDMLNFPKFPESPGTTYWRPYSRCYTKIFQLSQCS